MGAATFPIAAFSGSDASGRMFASLFLDPVAAGMAGWSWRDGLDVGGWPWDPQVAMPNVEETEVLLPLPPPVAAGRAGFRRRGPLPRRQLDGARGRPAQVDPGAAPHGLGNPSPCRCRRCSAATRRMSPLHPAARHRRSGSTRERPHPGAGRGPGGQRGGARAEGIRVPQNKGDIYVLRWCGAGEHGDPLERARCGGA